MSGGIFISYRREDSAGFAGRIYDRLTSRLERERIFFDVDNIEPGLDFVKVLSDRVGACDALVAIIGKDWLSARDKHNRRRLDDPNDFVRIEIEAALERDIRVIPVLVDGACMPRQADLPPSLKMLARRQGLEISHTRFDSDAVRLTKALALVEEECRKREAAEAERLARELRQQQEVAEAAKKAEEERRLAEAAAALLADQESRRLIDAEAARRADEEKRRIAESAAAEVEKRRRADEEAARTAGEQRRGTEAEAAKNASDERSADPVVTATLQPGSSSVSPVGPSHFAKWWVLALAAAGIVAMTALFLSAELRMRHEGAPIVDVKTPASPQADASVAASVLSPAPTPVAQTTPKASPPPQPASPTPSPEAAARAASAANDAGHGLCGAIDADGRAVAGSFAAAAEKRRRRPAGEGMRSGCGQPRGLRSAGRRAGRGVRGSRRSGGDCGLPSGADSVPVGCAHSI